MLAMEQYWAERAGKVLSLGSERQRKAGQSETRTVRKREKKKKNAEGDE